MIVNNIQVCCFSGTVILSESLIFDRNKAFDSLRVLNEKKKNLLKTIC
jgi:hypothetical protein